MSRLAKKPIPVPKTTEVKVDQGVVTVTGPKGELTRAFGGSITITPTEEGLVLTQAANTDHARAMWGTVASHIKNMIAGVEKPFEKKLIVEGIGFRVEVRGKNLVLQLGFSHPVEVAIPDGLTVTAENNIVTIVGVDKEMVGSFAAEVRSLKKPEPYKGKGIRYDGEVIRRKQGKKAV